MAEELALSATVVDRFSKPLNDLRNKLANIKTPDGVKALPRDFNAANSSISTLTRNVEVGLNRALVQLGVTVGGVAGAFNLVSSAVQRFSSQVPELAAVSRETGVSLNNLRALQTVGEKVGIEAGTIATAMKTAADNAYLMARGRGTAWTEVLKSYPAMARQMREAAKSGDTRRFAEIAIANIADVFNDPEKGGPAMARHLAQVIFGSADLSRFGLAGKRLGEMFEQAFNAAKISPEATARAKELKELFIDLRVAGEQFGNMATVTIAPGIIALGKALNGTFGEGSNSWMKREVIGFFKDLNSSLESLAALLNGDWMKALEKFGTFMDKMTPSGRIKGIIENGMGLNLNPSERSAWLREQIEKDRRAADDPNQPPLQRNMLRNRAQSNEEELRRLEKAVEEGVKKGVQGSNSTGLQPSGIQNAAFTPNGGAAGAVAGMQAGRRNALGGTIDRLPGATGGRSSRGDTGAAAGGDAPGGRLGGGPAVPKEQMERGRRVYDELRRLGWTHEAASVALGNAVQESGIGKHTNPGEGAAGLIHWRLDRLKRLRSYVASQGGQGIGTLEQQAQFLDKEIKGWQGRNGSAIRNIPGMKGSLVGINNIWRDYNLYAGGPQMVRAQIAQRFSNAFSGREPGAAPGAAAGRSPGDGTDIPFMTRVYRGERDAFLPRSWSRKQFENPFNPIPTGTAFGSLPRVMQGGNFNASLDVTLNNFPSGWRTRAEGGGLFKDVKVQSGRAMAAADEAGK